MIDFSFLLSKVEKIPGTPERPLSEAADILYYRYYVDSFYETVFGVYYELTKKGENPEQNHPLTLGWLEEKTAINKTDLLKVLVHEKIAEIIYDKKNPKKAVDVKFNVDCKKMIAHMKKQKEKKNRLWIKSKLLKWAPSYSNPEELLHFPLLQTEIEPQNEIEIDDDEDEDTPEKPKNKRGRKKKDKKPKVIIHRGMTVEEFEEKVSDPEVGFSTPFCNKDDIYMTVPVKRPPKKSKKRPPMTGRRRKKNKKKESTDRRDSDDENSSGPAFIIEQRTPSPVKSRHESPGESSSEDESPRSSPKQGKKKAPKKNCKPKTLKKFSTDDESDDEKHEPSVGRGKKSGRTGRPASNRGRKGSSPEKKSQHESSSKCNVMSIGSPKMKSTPKNLKKQVHSSDEEVHTQQVRARIRGSSLESSSSDEDHRIRTSRKRSTRQLKSDDNLMDAGNPKRSSRQVESALDNDDDLQHEETADLSFDPYDYHSQMAPFQNVRKNPEPIPMEVIEEKKPEEAEMPKLIPTLQVTTMEEDDEDDDAPPMLSPNYGQMPELISNNIPAFEQERRAPSEESDGPPVLQNSNIPVESLDLQQNQSQLGNQENLIEASVNLQNEPSRRSSTEQYQLQNTGAPGSSGLQPTYPGSIGHPGSAGSLHPGSSGALPPATSHPYPNSTGTPQMSQVQNNPPSWSLQYPLNQEEQNLSFSMSAPQNSQPMDLDYPRPEITKEPPKPKKVSSKKKKKEPSTASAIPPPKYPMQQPYDPTFGAAPFLQYNNPMAMVAAGPSGYYPYTQGVQAGTYNQNTMPWSTTPYNYSNFMTNSLQPTLAAAQPRFFPNYPLIPGTAAPTPAATLANPVSQGWQRPQNPAPNPSQFYSYPYPYYQT